MKTIIAGSRSITDPAVLRDALVKIDYTITEVISGGCPQGADALGEAWAQENNIPLIIYKANWDKYGRSAGMIRNELMASVADACICLWDGVSKGTAHMAEIAEETGIPVLVHVTPRTEQRVRLKPLKSIT